MEHSSTISLSSDANATLKLIATRSIMSLAFEPGDRFQQHRVRDLAHAGPPRQAHGRGNPVIGQAH